MMFAKGDCPDDECLERYLYHDLSFPERGKLWLHLTLCPSCRNRLGYLRWFSSALSEVKRKQAPDDFESQLIKSVSTWGPLEGSHPRGVTEGTGRLVSEVALVVLPLLAIGFLQGGEGALSSVLRVWRFFLQGQCFACVKAVLSAFRQDAPASFIILGRMLPSVALSVIVVAGALVLVVITQPRRQGGGEAS